MTNEEIILRDVLGAKIFTPEEIEAYFDEEGELPLHTFSEWKARGFSVKKGAKAVLCSVIWKHKSRKKSEETESTGEVVAIPEEEEKRFRDFVMVKAYFFSRSQVEKIKVSKA